MLYTCNKYHMCGYMCINVLKQDVKNFKINVQLFS